MITLLGDNFTKVPDGGPGDNWNKAATSPNRLELCALNGRTYTGILNLKSGGEVWRSRDGSDWERSLAGGFGDVKDNSGGDNAANTGLTPLIV